MAYYTVSSVRYYGAFEEVDGKVFDNYNSDYTDITRFNMGEDVKAITSVKRNGTALTSTTVTSPGSGEYYFLEPRYVVIHNDEKLTATTDMLVIKFDITVTDSEIQITGDGIDAYIDSRLATKYTVPLSSTPPIIAEISNRITAGKIMERKRLFYRETISDWNVNLLHDLKEMERQLDRIATGKDPLVDSSGNIVSKKRDFPASTCESHESVFRFGQIEDKATMDKIHDDYKDQGKGRTYEEL